MNRKQIAVTLGIMCFILTVSIFIQVKTIENTNSTISQSLKENELRDEVLKWKEKYDVTYEQLTQSGKDLEQIRKQATQNDKTSSAKQNEITRNNMLLGSYEVQGPGIEITLTDNNTGISKDGMEVIDLSKLVVHYNDLLEVINALNNAEAEAISVNGQRIVQTTAITCEGNVIKINGQRVSSPFVIKAIGSPGLLYGSMSMIGGYLYWMENEGVLVNIKQSDNVVIEKYNGVINYKYIKNEK